MKANITLDEALRPMEITCGECRGKMEVYPCPMPEGIGFCPHCSPAWLKSFAIFLMNQERAKNNLAGIPKKEGK